MTEAMLTTDFPQLNLVHSGKVRDMYAIPGHDDKLLMVATDRISAYDVILSAIPGKGAILTQLSLFWFDLLADIVDNHMITADVTEYPEACAPYAEQLRGRSILVKRTKPLPIECIVRGYISGSFWKAYQQDTNVCGFQLPEGMQESDKFPEPIFTPSTKAELGDHDENISFERMQEIVGVEKAEQIARISKALYTRAADYARTKGVIIADTKFELGEVDGKIILIDEVLTPDSSRFWAADKYEPGKSQESFDKQYLRDYLSSLDWDKNPPAPPLPEEIIVKTKARYDEAVERITGK
ncbi:phosphoribosylaminoimidazolesuccinocarboxamide synthase [Desulfotalea psychrophila]|uniref:Phosphoribosylaminoimidazole-succinocarboxamide synthase n=1 Tax=Desulfotalea psychrophila (strain LSv54 / DSM 12343) TaxID=177439 RepID=PUR7_DESPS|nr:phosphoribosylaminoimidazolesuccinocarboxamide synthase [Desulfotalea psychrophila]Q6AK95.1 RecName: Full=Phosphoribosylaminoimidazole-succinocarboxamide synthase; AltName: Full=SAICAR synthetase [Desulfotalea psychrophila LSv54]CAG37231.1 probable phosphoribosylamidoimidazole-succinocarboxamide synthase [Desulfotalea psychrophila LSv54]